MSTPRPRREGESDASYKAAMVELGKFNERMYGKDSSFVPGRSPRGTGTNDGGPNNAPSSGPFVPGRVKTPKTPVKPLRERIADNVATNIALKQRIEDIRKQIPVRKNKDPVMPVRPQVEIPKNVRPETPERPQEAARPMGIALPTPMKKAAGGAAKVRKGMMSPEGKILHAMNKVRGK
jgi:hypothetical protein